MSKDLYLLVDGTHANPDDCDVGADNELRHKDNGVPVALDANGNPQTIAQLSVDSKNEEAAKAGEDAAAEADRINADNAVAVEAEAKAPEGPVVTEINPATGEKTEDDLLLTTEDLKPAKAPAKAKAKPAKNREIRTR